jgi:hypothetical protein
VINGLQHVSRNGWSVVSSASLAKGGTWKRDRHHTSTKFRVAVVRWVHEIFKRPSYILILYPNLRLDPKVGSSLSVFRLEFCMHFYLSRAFYLPRPSHLSRFGFSNDIWRIVQIMKLVIMQFSSSSFCFLLRSNLLLSALFSSTLNQCEISCLTAMKIQVTLKMEERIHSETFVPYHITTRRHTTEQRLWPLYMVAPSTRQGVRPTKRKYRNFLPS